MFHIKRHNFFTSKNIFYAILIFCIIVLSFLITYLHKYSTVFSIYLYIELHPKLYVQHVSNDMRTGKKKKLM